LTGIRDRNAYTFTVRKPEEKRTTFEHVCSEGWLILRYTLNEIWREGMDWIHLAKIKAQWSALINVVMKLRVP
jgi:hypothetical protein